MNVVYAKLKMYFYTLTGLSNLLSQAALLFMTISICYDVFMRYVMREPTMWVLEINTFLVIAICIIPSADLLRSDSHLRVTFFSEKMSPHVQKMLKLLNVLVGLCMTGVITWKGFDMMYLAFLYDERMSTPLGTPYAIPYSFLPIGFGLLFLGYTIQGIDLLFNVDEKATSGTNTAVV